MSGPSAPARGSSPGREPTAPRPALRAALRTVAAELSAAGVPSPRNDAALLAGHVLAMSPGEVAAAAVLGVTLTADQARRLERLAACRAERVPLQHLTGQAGFRGLTLAVGPGVFVPRPETEVTAQLAIEALGGDPSYLVDLCTGSGAIAVAVAAERPATRVWAVEVSPEALAYARENLARTGLADRVTLVAGDARQALPDLAPIDGRVDVVTCNPPYIPPDAVPVDPEVRDHDPELALYGGGPDGLDLPVALAARALRLVRPGGLLVMEHADGQWPTLATALAGQGWVELADHADLAGRSRVATARAPGAAGGPAPGPREGTATGPT